MSSGFVSGGKAGEETERDDEWKRAQQEIENTRKAKADLAAQQDGKSLFEVLQANKEKKQAEFEEKARYKLHVSLDDDEADYLESILEKKRKEEANVRKETVEQLDLFRRQREEAERKAKGLEEEVTEAPQQEDPPQWAAVGRKRKKGLETGLLKGVKLRKSSSVAEDKKPVNQANDIKDFTRGTASKPLSTTESEETANMSAASLVATQKTVSATSSAKSTNTLTLGLGYASSDDED